MPRRHLIDTTFIALQHSVDDRTAAIKIIDAAIAEDLKRKEAMSEILKKQEINDVVKNLRRMSVRAYK